RTALLHDAERLLCGLIVLPGLAKPRTCVVINQKGLHLGTLEPNARDAAAFLDRYREWIADTPPGADQRLPKAVSDCLCVASRQLRQSSSWYRFAPLSEASGYRPEDLLAFAF